MTRYRTIVADPPWPGKWEVGERNGGNGKRYEGKPLAYSLMSLDAICALPVTDLAEADAHLYLWIPDRLLMEGAAGRVMRSWGFTPGRIIVWWAKRNPGLGRFPRAAHEAIALGTRGQLPYSGDVANTASVQEWRQPYANGGKLHSAKPDGMLDLIEQEAPGPRTVVRLDVAESSLPVLLEGVNAARVWLTDEGDGLYAFHATQSVGQSRKQPGTPAIDVLTGLVNELGDALDAEDVPQHLRDLWDDIVERYEARTGEGRMIARLPSYRKARDA